MGVRVIAGCVSLPSHVTNVFVRALTLKDPAWNIYEDQLA